MSDIAGSIAMQYATTLLHQPQGGKGILLGGVPATRARQASSCSAAARPAAMSALVAAGLGAEVIVFDKDRDKMVRRGMGANVTALYPHVPMSPTRCAARTWSSVRCSSPAHARHTWCRPTWCAAWRTGSVIVDISVDQGGCIETTRPTTWKAPTYRGKA